MASGAPAPARLGRYELLARIASGGMGEIFLARLEGAAGFEKLYVVKRILPHLADDVRFRSMLVSEARIASRMAHANICQVYELGETDGQLYIVMEHLEGMALLALLRRWSKAGAMLELGFVAGVITQVADALHYAHELADRDGEPLGIVHRDVTPGNIFLTDAGIAKVLDFGIAKVKDAQATTQTGTVKGKYAYMAPEQLRGVGLDRRADVFALGVVAFEMLALRRLFQRKTDYLTFRAVMEQPVPDIRRYRADAPDALAEMLARTLDREPAQRPPTARAFGADLLSAIGARPWSQHELADCLRQAFSAELGDRRQEAAAALQRTTVGEVAPGQTTMPLASEHGHPPHEDADDDDDFPAVESSSVDAPAELRAPAVRPFHGPTPPPFASETSTSGPQLEPLMTVAAPPAKRSVFWPLLAVAMVAVAAGALVLVWRQMQQPAQEIIITSEPVRATAPAPDAHDAGDAHDAPAIVAVGSAAAVVEPAGSATPVRADQPARRRPPANPYTAVVSARLDRLERCAKEHGPPPAATKLVIAISADGAPRSVTLQPATLDRSPFAGCIRAALSGVAFPRAAHEQVLTVPLSVKPT